MPERYGMTEAYLVFRVCERFGIDPEVFEAFPAGKQRLYLAYGTWRLRQEQQELALLAAARRAL